jgi:fructose-specific phosphotransferase system IIC component
MYLFVLVPLKLGGTIGILRNTIWGIDKIIFGIIIGSIVFLIGVWADKFQRKKFKKIFFPFQKVVFPVLALFITSLVFYFVTKMP